MSKLTTLRKKIAQLEAEYARAAKLEMDAAVGKVKELMASLGVTLEHLGKPSSSAIRKTANAKKPSAKKAAPGRTGAGIPKYRDPNTGKTWTGFGRAPGWIAGVKDRDAFLVGKSGAALPSVRDAKGAIKKAKLRKVKATTPAKKVAVRTAKRPAPAEAVAARKKAPAKKRTAKVPAVKSPAVKKHAAKAIAKKKVLAQRAPGSPGNSTGDDSSGT